jgi:hypothetical protein
VKVLLIVPVNILLLWLDSIGALYNIVPILGAIALLGGAFLSVVYAPLQALTNSLGSISQDANKTWGER